MNDQCCCYKLNDDYEMYYWSFHILDDLRCSYEFVKLFWYVKQWSFQLFYINISVKMSVFSKYNTIIRKKKHYFIKNSSQVRSLSRWKKKQTTKYLLFKISGFCELSLMLLLRAFVYLFTFFGQFSKLYRYTYSQMTFSKRIYKKSRSTCFILPTYIKLSYQYHSYIR